MKDSPVELSIIVPCFNERGRLLATTDAVRRFLDEREYSAEVLLIDDGSSDGTQQVMRSIADADRRVRVETLPVNRGKGAAVRHGVEKSRGRAVVFFDADLSYPLVSIDRALAELRGGAEVVVGARDLASKSPLSTYSVARRAASLVFNALVDATLGLGIPDTQCGFKMFDGSVGREIFRRTTIDRFGFDVEVLYIARSWKLRLVRMPIEMTHRAGSTVRFLHDSVQMASDILRIRRNAATGAYHRALTPESAPNDGRAR